MRKIVFLIVAFFLILSSMNYTEAPNEIKLTDPVISDGTSKLLLIDSESFKVAWEDYSNAKTYEISFTSDDINIKEIVDSTEFKISGFSENDSGLLVIKGLDADGEVISQPTQVVVAYPPSECMSLDIEKPVNRVLNKYNYNDLKNSIFSFNYIRGIEKFRVRIYSDDKIYVDKFQLMNLGTFPQNIDDGLDKTLTVEVSALSSDKVLSTESFTIGYFNDVKRNYKLNIIGYDKNRPYWSNNVRIDLYDNHSELDSSNITYYKVRIKSDEGDYDKTTITSVPNYSFSDGFILDKLENGSYDIEVEAFNPLTYIEGFDINKSHSTEELVNNTLTTETLGRDILNIQVLGGSSAIYAPSIWAMESVDGIIKYLPNELNNNYTERITRKEACRVLVSLYTDISGKDISITSPFFSDTDDQYISVAYSVGLVKGKSKEIFDPNGYITREEFAMIACTLCNSLGYDTSSYSISKFVDQEDITGWAEGSIDYLVENKIIRGTPDGKFYPQNKISREEAYVVVYNLLKFLNNSLINS